MFGPILHVASFEADDIDKIISDINAKGYGLTFGLHTRIEARVQHIVDGIHAGNIYVNRNQIGAVVGSQPFGGEGLSGTGPKAGGPLYLHRLLARTPGPVFERPAAELPALEAFAEWLERDGRALLEGDDIAVLRDRLDAYRTRRIDGLTLTLPGPTGEDDSLRFVPRGRIAGVASGSAARLHQVLVALATGNRLLLDDNDITRKLAAALPPALAAQVELDAGWQEADFGALLFDGPDSEADAWRVRLAARRGPIVGLLRPEPEYDPARLVHERTVSVNTAAAGGNASLMAMGA